MATWLRSTTAQSAVPSKVDFVGLRHVSHCSLLLSLSCSAAVGSQVLRRSVCRYQVRPFCHCTLSCPKPTVTRPFAGSMTPTRTYLQSLGNYNLGQNCWENCVLGEHFSKHRSCTGSSLSPFPWKQCCCVLKRKPDPWAFLGSNIELGEGDFFPQRRPFGNTFVV